MAGKIHARLMRPEHRVGCGLELRVTFPVAPQLKADVDVRIAPKVRPHSVGGEADRIRIPGARGGTAKAIHPVGRFRSDMDRQPRDFDMTSRWKRSFSDMMSCGMNSLSDMPLGCVCECRAQREHRGNCRDQ